MAKQVSMTALRDFVRKKAEVFLDQKNVTSVGIGYKEVRGRRTKELSIQFTVGRKVGLESLEALDTPPIPAFFEIEGVKVPTDVIERSYEKAARAVTPSPGSERKRAIDPIVPGVSIGHRDISAGTAGCVVYDASSGQPYILSNWHVLNGPTGKLGDPVVQPGRHDDNRVERNTVGTLVRSHLGVAGDCAIASIEGRGLSAEILDLGVSVARIGEPELDDVVIKSGRTTDVTYGIVKRVHVVANIDYDEAGTKEIGCFEIGPYQTKPAANGEISMGGDSGSSWLSVARGRATDMMLGLHFAGEIGDEPEHALACYAASVFEKLQILPAKPVANRREDVGGLGYSINFLGVTVLLPVAATTAIENDLVVVNGRAVLDYMHFSLSMSKNRRFARWVAWNIDGNSTKRLSRNGIPFIKDPNVPDEYQVGNELYSNNDLDRGHIARRQDLLWGPIGDARRANVDSFFYTNMTPQHQAFNQSSAGGIWGALEDALYADVEVHDLRLSLLGGPILQDDDRLYRGVQIPRDFWKILYFRESSDGPLIAKGYVLTQRDLIAGLEALELPEFHVYEVPIPEIGTMTKLQLPEGTDAPEGAGRRKAKKRKAVESISSGAAGIRMIKTLNDVVD